MGLQQGGERMSMTLLESVVRIKIMLYVIESRSVDRSMNFGTAQAVLVTNFTFNLLILYMQDCVGYNREHLPVHISSISGLCKDY